MKKKQKLIIILIAIIAALAGVLIAILLMLHSNKIKQYDTQLSLGDKYLEDMKYEDAVIAYTQAINLSPKQEKAYIQLSNVYVQTEEYDKALSVLDTAKDAISDKDSLAAIETQRQQVVTYQEESQKEDTPDNTDGTENDTDNTEDTPEDTSNNITSAMAQEVVKNVLGFDYIGNQSIPMSFMFGQNERYVESTNMTGCLATYIKDLDGDGTVEILAVTMEYQTPENYGGSMGASDFMCLHVLSQSGMAWLDAPYMLGTEPGIMKYWEGLNSGTMPGRFDVFVRDEADRTYIYMEMFETSQYFSDGLSYGLRRLYYADGQLIEDWTGENEGFGFAGSSGIDGYLALNPNVGDPYEQSSCQDFVNRFQALGFQNMDHLDMDYAIMDADSTVGKVFRCYKKETVSSDTFIQYSINNAGLLSNCAEATMTDYANQ